jgi:hypothetical protein
MKKLLLGLVLVFRALVSNAQTQEVVPDLKPYEDISSRLFISKVVEMPGKTQKEISTQFKNWASTSFVNLKEVMVSETENQIVLNYITNTNTYFKLFGVKNIYTMDWYVRLVAQFKDGKIRIQFYDDGNVYKPSQYSGYPSSPSRSMYVSVVTNKPESFKDMHKSVNIMYNLHYQWQLNVSSMSLSCEKGMLNNTLSIKKDDF